MKEHRDEFPVELMARALDVSRTGYYTWLKRSPSFRQQAQVRFDEAVLIEFEKSKERYGCERVAKALKRQGQPCTKNRVARSLKRQRLHAHAPKKFKTTTDSRHEYPIAENILNRNFTAESPNQKWVGDITYLPSLHGWLYLAVFIDLYSRRVVGWHISDSLKHDSALAAFYRAAGARGSVRDLILHTDRGVQYCCTGFTDVMKLCGVVQSMSRKGNCWDNAVAESFFSTLKREMLGNYVFLDLQDAEKRLFEYIEVEYNRQRLHSSIGYVPPVEFEEVRLRKSA